MKSLIHYLLHPMPWLVMGFFVFGPLLAALGQVVGRKFRVLFISSKQPYLLAINNIRQYNQGNGIEFKEKVIAIPKT